MDIIFSHRPLAGVSVGAFSENNRIFIAFALVNDGTSRNMLFHKDRKDSFCRKTARSIISCRIKSAIENNAGPMTFVFDINISSRDFIKRFRETFKPTIDETDNFFNDVCDFGGTETRVRSSVKTILQRLFNTTMEAITHESASV